MFTKQLKSGGYDLAGSLDYTQQTSDVYWEYPASRDRTFLRRCAIMSLTVGNEPIVTNWLSHLTGDTKLKIVERLAERKTLPGTLEMYHVLQF